ncbi:unnamed protein product [Enterobius vermicularis]|uniref:WD repeat-containing protein 37 n=1 Tax=Enterobius vermicularis TaxID=51028 RepID=A0A0N4VLQ6_ENTVE|nr:unnamed protein product [Enterobius vermicularis]
MIANISMVRDQARLYNLFGDIEKEFDALYIENCALRTRLSQLGERLGEPVSFSSELLSVNSENAMSRKDTGKKAMQVSQKLKTAFRVPPGKFVQTLKAGVSDSSRRVKYVRCFTGHRDGVWHVSTSKGTQGILASASADQVCRLWSLDTGLCIGQYSGHSGSVNGVSFNPVSTDPNDLVVATASGDYTVHVWKYSLLGDVPHQMGSSEEELESTDVKTLGEDSTDVDPVMPGVIRQPVCSLTGHTNVVIAVDWICNGEQLLTASWDRNANVYDVEREEILNVLSGHDDELTHCSAHSSQKLVVTASRDSTFRLWDFRESIQSVAVFQGHNDSVTSVVFSTGEKVVSGSDDRCVKVWDLRNMRSAIATVRLNSAVNRLSVSSRSLVAIPQDDRNIHIYDLNSVRLTRVPRANSKLLRNFVALSTYEAEFKGHRRIVYCAAWADDHPANDLITCGFDKRIIGWKTSFLKE